MPTGVSWAICIATIDESMPIPIRGLTGMSATTRMQMRLTISMATPMA